MTSPDSVRSPLITPLVLRRGRVFAAYIVFVQVLLLATAGLILRQRGYGLIPVPLAGAGLLVWPALAWLRCRTEIGPDGIRNRTVLSQELIAWQDVARVMPASASSTVVILRNRGGLVSLAGVRGVRPRNGPDLGELVSVVQAEIERHRPAGATPAETVPEVIHRRLTWAPVRPFIALLGFLSVLCAVFTARYGWPLLSAAFLLGLTGFTILATARGRTEIGPDGIRNRALIKQVFIPWADIERVNVPDMPPRGIKVVRRRGGATTTLADVFPDGLALDDIADVIRERAGATEPADEPVRGEAGPLSLRPSRRPLLWTVPFGAATAAGVVLTLRDDGYFFLLYLTMVVVYLVTLTLKLLRGRTVAGPDGLRNRLIGKTRDVSWSDVGGFIVIPSLFGRVVHVTVKGGKKAELAAPREGLLSGAAALDSSVETMRALAAARGSEPPSVQAISVRAGRTVMVIALVAVTVISVVNWKPWIEPWWPSRHEATRLPRACALLDADTLRRLVPRAGRPDGDADDFGYFTTTACVVQGVAGSALDLDLRLQRRSGSKSGTRAAVDEFAEWKTISSGEAVWHITASGQVPRLGDESWRVLSTGDGDTRVRLVARRHNVLVRVRYSAGRPAAQVAADAEELARAALSRIPDDH